MTQITINIENPAILPSLKKILNATEGVSIATPKKRKLSSYEKSIKDYEEGKYIAFESAEEAAEYLRKL